MTFYEKIGFTLSIATLLFVYITPRLQESKLLDFIMIGYMGIVMFVFMTGIWKIIFKI